MREVHSIATCFEERQNDGLKGGFPALVLYVSRVQRARISEWTEMSIAFVGLSTFSMSEVIRDLGTASVGCETAYRQDALRMIRSQS
jgi:hypothetical protein